MATPAQIEANRANSQLSTGPRTDEGKARSSTNAKTHALFASLESLAPTELERFQRFLDFQTNSWSPAGEADTRLVLDLALADFRRDRARALEGAWFADRVEQLRKDDGLPETLTPAQVIRLEARALQQDCDCSMVLSRLFKWERAFNRDFDRLTAQLREASFNRFFEQAKTKPIPHQPPVPSTTSPVAQAPLPVRATCSAPTSGTNAASPAPAAASATPRSAPCPCGSGQKYKRCCGRNAPPVLHRAA